MKIAISNLNVNTFEDIFHKINISILTAKRGSINIDISEVKFMDPYSIINFCMLLRYAQKYFSNISLTFPQDNNVAGYLERINLISNIPNGIKLINKPRLERKFLPSDVLLELTPIQKQSDVHNVIKHSVTKIGHILQTSLGYTEKDIGSFCTALSETCQNIIDHSEDQGLVSVQKYHKNSNYVIIAVSDLGIGIKKSLSKRYNVSTWNHAKAIQNALRLGTSRFPDRGKGLYIVNEIVKRHKGKLIIRSHSGRTEIGTNIKSSNVPYFPGTQIYIRL